MWSNMAIDADVLSAGFRRPTVRRSFLSYAAMSRFALLVVSLLTLGSCSKLLRLDIFNESLTSLIFCSDERPADCKSIEPGQSKQLKWNVGAFSVTTPGEKFMYSASFPEPRELYLNRKEGSVALVVSENFDILALRPSVSPKQVAGYAQPEGFPLRPNRSLDPTSVGKPLSAAQLPRYASSNDAR